ncbi:hypothetical protein SLE2022_153420 [Rubroshorea leprosula]
MGESDLRNRPLNPSALDSEPQPRLPSLNIIAYSNSPSPLLIQSELSGVEVAEFNLSLKTLIPIPLFEQIQCLINKDRSFPEFNNVGLVDWLFLELKRWRRAIGKPTRCLMCTYMIIW